MQPQPQQGIMISGIGEGETSEYIKSLQQEGYANYSLFWNRANRFFLYITRKC